MMMKGESMQTSIRSLLSRAVRSRAAGVAVALLAALGIVVQGLAAPAAADVNPQIEVTDLSLTKVNSAEEEQAGQLYVSSLALLTFKWDATKITPKEGDSFTVTLPQEFNFHSTDTVPMKREGTDEVGSCTVAGQTVTCTFGSQITPLIQAGNRDIRGTGKFQLIVKTYTTEKALPFDINSVKTVKVDLPGGGGIPNPAADRKYRRDLDLSKGYNGIMKEGDELALWYFDFGGQKLQDALGVTFDGQTPRTIKFKDTLGAGMTCPPLKEIYLYAIDSEENPSQRLLLAKDTDTESTDVGQGKFEVTGKCGKLASDGTTPITFEAKGPFRATTNYKLEYRTGFTGDGKARRGTDYTNTVSVEGTKFKTTSTTSYVKAASVDVVMKQGLGTFSIAKKIAADYANQVAAGVTFTVAFDYELPANTDQYPNRTAPAGTLNPDKRTGTATMEVEPGQTTPAYSKGFPTGTKISNLHEELSTANRALPDGYVWKEPKFTIGSTPTTGLTIEDQKNTKVDLLNTVGPADKGRFSVTKTVAGDAGADAPTTYTFDYTCTADRKDTIKGTIVVGKGQSKNSDEIPVGYSCSVKERVDKGQDGTAYVEGYTLDVTTGADVIIAKGAVPNIDVTNTYAPLKGGFVISKTVDGDGAALAKDKEFTFDYTCTPLTGAAQVKGTVVVKGGENGAVTDVPVGSCSVSERDATINGASLNTVLTVDGSSDGVNNGTAVFNVKDGVTVKVAATNTYVLDRGSFSVAKKVVGGADSFTKDTFVFDYVCTDGTEGRLDVPGDGTAVEGPRVPTGTECTVTERAQTANRDGYTVTSELSDNGKVTISQKDAVVAVTATNTYTPVPKVPSKQLAKTGASNVAVVGVVGSLLVVVGGVLIALKRRRHDA